MLALFVSCSSSPHYIHDIQNNLLLSVSDDDKVSVWYFMLIYGCSKHVVFKCLDCVSREKSSQEGGSVGIGKLSILIGRWLGIFPGFLEQKKRNHALNMITDI